MSCANVFPQKLLRTISDMQKDFDSVALENQRKERLHAVADDPTTRGASGFSLGSGSDFTSIDAATPLLNQQQQQRVQVMRVGGKEVVQHDIAAVEAVRVPSSPLPAPHAAMQEFQQEQLNAFTRLESDLAGLAEVNATLQQGFGIIDGGLPGVPRGSHVDYGARCCNHSGASVTRVGRVCV